MGTERSDPADQCSFGLLPALKDRICGSMRCPVKESIRRRGLNPSTRFIDLISGIVRIGGELTTLETGVGVGSQSRTATTTNSSVSGVPTMQRSQGSVERLHRRREARLGCPLYPGTASLAFASPGNFGALDLAMYREPRCSN